MITPYNAQKQLIRYLASKEGLKGIEVSTVDGFQGREVDIVIFSCVRSNSRSSSNSISSNIGLLSEERRLNVAITRPKICLWFVGDVSYFEHCASAIFTKLVRFVKAKNYIYPEYSYSNSGGQYGNERRGGSVYNGHDFRERHGSNRDSYDRRGNFNDHYQEPPRWTNQGGYYESSRNYYDNRNNYQHRR